MARGKPFAPGKDPRRNLDTPPPPGQGRGPGNPGNPDPNPSTRFGAGNRGGKPGRKARSTIGAEFAAKEGISPQERPLAFFMAMMKGEPFTVRRLAAGGKLEEETYYPTIDDMKWGAGMAAPYMHPKLANIEHTGNVNVTHEDFIEMLDEEEHGGDSRTRH